MHKCTNAQVNTFLVTKLSQEGRTYTYTVNTMVYDNATALVDFDGADDAAVGDADDVAVAPDPVADADAAAAHDANGDDTEDGDDAGDDDASQAPAFLAGCGHWTNIHFEMGLPTTPMHSILCTSIHCTVL